jgi:AraC-like DNA-binding protein
VAEARRSGCRRELSDPARAGAAIAEIARRRGFRSASHFTRAFTARYGCGPRELRRSQTATARWLP